MQMSATVTKQRQSYEEPLHYFNDYSLSKPSVSQ